MARFVKHKPCPDCGSRDNRGVWDDGSEWCFGCHSYTPPQGNKMVEQFVNRKVEKKRGNNVVTLPEDALPYIPDSVKSWLDKYQLTKAQIDSLNLLYSYERSLLIFPVYANNELLMWQGRYFGEKPKHPKYVTYGAKDVIHIIECGKRDGSVCVVEDIVSAIKLSTVIDAVPLLGSHLSSKLATRLARSYETLTIWLDYDKAVESVKFRQEFAPLFKDVTSIVTKLDPKEYSHDDIAKLIQQSKAGW